MADVEKVLKGLECCTADLMKYHQSHFCDMCPYKSTNPQITYCFNKRDLMRDALALLKAQQLRVLTVGEIRLLRDCPVWRETKNSRQNLYQGWVLFYDIQKGMGITGERFGMAEPNGRVSWFKTDDYSKTWRCWSARPTDEQRKAAKWG